MQKYSRANRIAKFYDVPPRHRGVTTPKPTPSSDNQGWLVMLLFTIALLVVLYLTREF